MLGEASGISIGLAVVIGAAIAAMWIRIQGQFSAAETARQENERDLSNYKLYVQSNFVTSATLEKTEERLVIAMEKLATRVETLIGRIEAMTTEIVKLTANQ